MENCLFGLFDILGYKNFCENCDGQIAEKLLTAVYNMDIDIPNVVIGGIKGSRESVLKLVKPMKWLTFSDTIFCAIPLEPSLSGDALVSQSMTFLLHTLILNRHMFEIGLPLRGTIHTGEILIAKSGYMGKAIVEAYELAQRVDLAASVFSKSAANHLINSIPPTNSFFGVLKGLMVEYEVPLKNDATESLHTLNWMNIRIGETTGDIPNCNEFVSSRFQAHKKTMDIGATIKATNTEKLLNFWKQQRKQTDQSL